MPKEENAHRRGERPHRQDATRKNLAKHRNNLTHHGKGLTAKKTGLRIAVPLKLRMDALDMTLGDVIARCRSTGVISQYLIHHIRPQGEARRGDPIRLISISQAFAKARTLAGIQGEDAPTFHERSLCARTYKDQDNVDTKVLLGHTSDDMATLHENSRGLTPGKVRIDAA